METIWNKFCRAIESLSQDKKTNYLNLVAQAKIYDFEMSISDDVKVAYLKKFGDYLEDFRLPFPVVALKGVTGSGSLVLVADSVKDQVGFDDYRTVIIFNDMNACMEDCERLGVTAMAKKMFPWKNFNQKWPTGAEEFLSFKMMDLATDDTNEISEAQCEFENNVLLLYGIPCRKQPAEKKDFEKTLNANFFNILLPALTDFILLNQPKQFTLEMRPKNVRTFKGKKLPRYHERPVYTLLKPYEIRKRMGLKQGIEPGSSKTPHERSGHYRTLRNERYGERIGERIWVKPTWIGKSEAQVGNKFYKVILDSKETLIFHSDRGSQYHRQFSLFLQHWLVINLDFNRGN